MQLFGVLLLCCCFAVVWHTGESCQHRRNLEPIIRHFTVKAKKGQTTAQSRQHISDLYKHDDDCGNILTHTLIKGKGINAEYEKGTHQSTYEIRRKDDDKLLQTVVATVNVTVPEGPEGPNYCGQPDNKSVYSWNCSAQLENSTSGRCKPHCKDGHTAMKKEIYCNDGKWLIGEVCKDMTPPTLKCPNQKTVISGPIGGSKLVSWREAYVVKHSGTPVKKMSYDPQNGTSFHVGNNTVTAYAFDEAGNLGSCSFKVTVIEWKCNSPAPNITNGTKICTHNDLVGSTCFYKCAKGYNLKGNTLLNCTANKTWDGLIPPPECERIYCGNPPRVMNGNYRCPAGHYYFESVCLLNCLEGYQILDFPEIHCKSDGNWSSPGVCQDVEPPSITCPDDVEVFAARLGEVTTATWPEPDVHDNSGNFTVVSSLSSGSEFQSGVTRVHITATDPSGNRRNCTFTVSVKSVTCEDPYESFSRLNEASFNETESGASRDGFNGTEGMLFHRGPHGYVHGSTWNVTCRPGFELQGSDTITCEVDNSTYPPVSRWEWPGDREGMRPSCFRVLCSPLKPPINGALSCFQSIFGGVCYMHCQKRFTVPEMEWENQNGQFLCHTDGSWHPPSVPDCTERIRPRTMKVNLDYFYFGRCDTEESKLLIKQQFMKRFEANLPDFNNAFPECNIANIKVYCGESGKRRRRSADSEYVVITVEAMFPYDDSQASYKKVQSRVREVVGFLQEKVDDGAFEIEGLTADEYTVGSSGLTCDCPAGTKCEVSGGSLSCSGCPKGFFMPENKKTCQECPKGTYQDRENAADCTSCPPGTSTLTNGSRELTDCIELCRPGQVSHDGFIPCQICPVGSYQAEEGGTKCHQCPVWTSTVYDASVSHDECVAADVLLRDTEVSYNVTSSTATLAAWINIADVMSVLQVSLLTSDSQDLQLLLALNGSSLHHNGVPVLSSTTMDLRYDLWIHVALTTGKNSSSSKLYINGQLLDDLSANITDIVAITGEARGEVALSGMIASDTLLSPDEVEEASLTCVVDFSTQTSLAKLTSVPASRVPSYCDATDECTPSPCGNHTCRNLIGPDFACYCQDGWTGDLCHLPPDHCKDVTCLNEATCVSNPTDFTCQCPSGYTGRFCEDETVDVGWGQWSLWSKCSASCGEGMQSRTRLCEDPLPSVSGANCTDSEENQRQACNSTLIGGSCIGDDSETRVCNILVCQENEDGSGDETSGDEMSIY